MGSLPFRFDTLIIPFLVYSFNSFIVHFYEQSVNFIKNALLARPYTAFAETFSYGKEGGEPWRKPLPVPTGNAFSGSGLQLLRPLQIHQYASSGRRAVYLRSQLLRRAQGGRSDQVTKKGVLHKPVQHTLTFIKIRRNQGRIPLPPWREMVSPVMYLPPGLARNRQTCPMSFSGSPNRPMGTAAMVFS